MKKLRLAALAVTLFAIPLMMGIGLAHAQSFNGGDNINLASGKKVDGSYYAFGRTIIIAGEVNGDVYCAGQTATISGTVHGDVICAAQTLAISGTIDGDIRAAGQTLNIDATVGRNASVAGQTITISAETTIAGDLSLGGQIATINGAVGRDLAIGSQNATVNASVARDIKATGEKLTMGSNSTARNVSFTSVNEASLENGSKITKYQHHTPEKHEKKQNPMGLKFGLFAAIFIITSLLFTSMVLVILLPKTFEHVTEGALDAPGMSLLTGLVASIAVPVLGFSLLITVIGIPLAIMLGMVWLILLFLSGPFFAFYIGRLLISGSTNPLLVMVVGSVLVLFIYFIPFVGQLLLLIAGLMGTGMILRSLWRNWQRPHYHMEHAHTAQKHTK